LLLFFNTLPVIQLNNGTSQSVLEAGQETSQPPAVDIAALTAASVGMLVSAQGLHRVVTTHNQSFNTFQLISANCGIWLAVLEAGQVTSPPLQLLSSTYFFVAGS
jgi:hypothetical protein